MFIKEHTPKNLVILWILLFQQTTEWKMKESEKKDKYEYLT